MRLFQTPPTPDLAAHALSVGEFLVKLAGIVGALWVALMKIWKPYQTWRRSHYRELTKDVLAPELKQLDELTGLRVLCERILEGQKRFGERQDQIFEEMDHFHLVAQENSDRHDEMNLLLDEVGFTSDRRRATAKEQRERVERLLADLKAFKTARDRREEETDTDDSPQRAD